MMKNRRKSSKS